MTQYDSRRNEIWYQLDVSNLTLMWLIISEKGFVTTLIFANSHHTDNKICKTHNLYWVEEKNVFFEGNKEDRWQALKLNPKPKRPRKVSDHIKQN